MDLLDNDLSAENTAKLAELLSFKQTKINSKGMPYYDGDTFADVGAELLLGRRPLPGDEPIDAMDDKYGIEFKILENNPTGKLKRVGCSLLNGDVKPWGYLSFLGLEKSMCSDKNNANKIGNGFLEFARKSKEGFLSANNISVDSFAFVMGQYWKKPKAEFMTYQVFSYKMPKFPRELTWKFTPSGKTLVGYDDDRKVIDWSCLSNGKSDWYPLAVDADYKSIEFIIPNQLDKFKKIVLELMATSKNGDIENANRQKEELVYLFQRMSSPSSLLKK